MSVEPLSFLGLPREIRDLIYTAIFQSLVYRWPDTSVPPGYWIPDHRLSILRANRQIYAEAGPLVLRHVLIRCRSALDMDLLLAMLSPIQKRQLRHLEVGPIYHRHGVFYKQFWYESAFHQGFWYTFHSFVLKPSIGLRHTVDDTEPGSPCFRSWKV